MNAPELSIVLPCYNESGNIPLLVKLLQETLEPLKRSYEIIVTDDCSKDNSWELLKGMTAKDSRIRAQRFGKNCGLSAALWAGIQAARGIALPGAGNPKHAALGTGHQVLVSDPSTGKIFFINGTTKALTRTIHLLYSPWGLQVNPVTNKIYVSLSQAVFVAAIAP